MSHLLFLPCWTVPFSHIFVKKIKNTSAGSRMVGAAAMHIEHCSYLSVVGSSPSSDNLLDISPHSFIASHPELSRLIEPTGKNTFKNPLSSSKLYSFFGQYVNTFPNLAPVRISAFLTARTDWVIMCKVIQCMVHDSSALLCQVVQEG